MRAAPGVTVAPGGAGVAPPAALEAQAVEKWFGPQPAVRRIDFSLAAGEFLTLFGPNGAGKTTLLRMLAGSIRPTRGAIRVVGEALDAEETGWRRRIGVLSHQTFLYGQLTAEENLRFFGRLYGLDALEDRVASALEEVGLPDRARERVRGFSRGMQQRLALARTLLHEPDVVLLDEPYTGLDPHAARLLRGILERLRDGRRTVVLVTHNISQGLELADRVVVQVRGRWVSDERRVEIDPLGFEQVYADRVAGAS